MTLKKRELVLLLALFLIIMGIGYYEWLWQPMSDQITQLQSSNNNLQADIMRARAERNKLTGLAKEKTAAELELEKLHQLVPVAPGIPDLIHFIEKQTRDSGSILWTIAYPAASTSGSEAGIDLTAPQPAASPQTNVSSQKESTADTNKSGEVTVEVIARGDYESLYNLLLKVESDNRLLSINPVTIELIKQDDESKPITPVNPGESPSESEYVPVSSYNDLELSFTVTGYYDKQSTLEVKDTTNVQTNKLGRDNPFRL